MLSNLPEFRRSESQVDVLFFGLVQFLIANFWVVCDCRNCITPLSALYLHSKRVYFLNKVHIKTDKAILHILEFYCSLPGVLKQNWYTWSTTGSFQACFSSHLWLVKHQQDTHKLFQETLPSRGLFSGVQISGKQLTPSLVLLMQNTWAFTL